jgi:hypothetical protein
MSKKQQGDLIQMDNIVSIEEQSKPPCITTIDLWRLPCLQVLLQVKVSMTELRQWKER